MSKFHKNVRVLEITVSPDVSDNQFHVTAVNFRRDGLAGVAYPVLFTTAAGNPEDIYLNEQIEGPMLIRLTGTIQA